MSHNSRKSLVAKIKKLPSILAQSNVLPNLQKTLASFLALIVFATPSMPLMLTIGAVTMTVIPEKVLAYDGCMDPGYLEYDPGADNDPGGYCNTVIVAGCTDSNYLEYNPSANQDNGSCVTPKVTGCTNAAASNYNSSANVDDGSCVICGDNSVQIPEQCDDGNINAGDGCSASCAFEFYVVTKHALGNKIRLVFSHNLDTGFVPDVGDFIVLVNAIPVTITSLQIQSNYHLEIFLANNLLPSDTININYIPGSNPLTSLSTGEILGGFNDTVTNLTNPGSILVGLNPLGYSLHGNKLYIGDRNAMQINQNLTETVSVVDTFLNEYLGSINVLSDPYGLLTVGNKVYVGNYNSNKIQVIDTSTDVVLTTISLPLGSAPYYMESVGQKLYVGSLSDKIFVINTNTDTITSTITNGSLSGPAFLIKFGSNIYALNQNSNIVSIINTNTDTFVSNIVVGNTPRNFFISGTKLYVGASSTLSVIDLLTNTNVNSVVFGANISDMVQINDKIYVSLNGVSQIHVIDANTLNVDTNINVPFTSQKLIVYKDRVYVGLQGYINTSNNTYSSTFSAPLGGIVNQLILLGNKIFAIVENNTVRIFSPLTNTDLNLTSPNLLSIASTSPDANYTVGDNINITANFNIALGLGSKMRVTLNTGDVVDLTTVSGSDLSGTYTVGAGDITSDLTITDIFTDSNFTSVVDASGNNAGSSFSIFASPDLSNDTPRNLGDLKNISVGGGVCSIATGTNPYQMVTVGTYAYAANMGSDNVSVIDTATNTVIDTISIGDGPYGLTYNSTSKELYIANTFSDNVSVIDLDPANIGTYHTVTHTINAGIQPYYATSLGGMVYVTNNISNTVSVIDTATHAVTATVGVGTAPRGIRAHGTNLYVANYGSGSYGAAPTGNGTVSVINSLTNTVTDTITVGVGPRGVTVLGDEVYVANFESDTVSVINALTNTVTHTITVGDTPRGITASNGNIYVENYQAGTISIIDPLTHTASSEYPVGNTPAGMTTVGTDLYISRFTDNVVSIFDTTNNTLKSSCLADSTSPTFTMQFYSDVGLTTPIADNATLKSGTYYIKITSDEALTGAPTITINAEGTANDVTDATTTLISGNDYSYTYVITSDALAVGGAFANISITGTDTAANTATNADPSNEATKTIYTDTVADASPGTPDMSAGTDTGISSTDNTTNDTTPDFTLSCVTGSTVTLTSSLDGVIGSGACVAGTVTITSSTLSEGVHTNINASQADIAGNVSAVSGDIVVTIDTTVPSAPAITSVDGDVTLPYTTLDTTPDVVVTTSVGDTATITAWTCSPTPAVSTSVTCTPSSALSPGANSVNVILTDSAGNSSSATVLPFTINSPDTTAPTISTVTPITTPTTDTTPDYTFTTNEAGTITYGGSCTSVTTSAIVGNNTITLSTLTPGTYTNCTIRVTDAATNASSILAIPSFVISTSSTGGGGSTPIVTGNQFCTGILPSKAIVIQSGYSGKSHAWRHDSSPTGPYQWCSFRCPNNTLYSSISSSCESISTTPPSITLPPPLPTITPVAPVPRSFLVPTPKRPFWKPWKFPTLNSADDTVSAISQTVSYAGKNNTDFWYPSEDDAIVEKLQKEHPEKNITETDYMNQCVTKESQPYYRKCSIGFDFDTAILFRDDVLCEGFIVKQVSESDYRFTSTAPRKEVTGIAVKMKRIEGKNVALETSSQRAQDTYTDVGHGNDSAEWIAPVVATALKYDIISSERKTFEGDRSVTRAEAYAMIMKSVCMNVTQNTSSDWRKNVHTLAQEQGLTIKSWETFSPERPILRQELFVLASRAGDWAERTGGCDPKPEYCFLK